MVTTTEESTLLRFCELLNAWKEGHDAAHLAAAFAAIELAMARDDRDQALFMAHVATVATGLQVTVGEGCGIGSMH